MCQRVLYFSQFRREIYISISIDADDHFSARREARGGEKSKEKEKRSGDVWSRKFDRGLNLISVVGRRLN